MSEEAVEPQAEFDEIMDQGDELIEHDEVEEVSEEVEERRPSTKQVPLSVVQKLRQQKRELELQLQWEQQERQKMAHLPAQKKEEEDDSEYETATRKELKNSIVTSQAEAIRVIEEKLWIKQNPERFEYVMDNLENFLKQRPNLRGAINDAENRYEEAYILMDALTPKQKAQLKSPTAQQKKPAPNSPGGVPKSAAFNDSVDLMNMSDQEYLEWRKSKSKRR